jgi:hypothetical protein
LYRSITQPWWRRKIGKEKAGRKKKIEEEKIEDRH